MEWQGLSHLWVLMAEMSQPQASPFPSLQVACPYVGCGESFADHSTIHAQVSAVARSVGPAGSWPRIQALAPAASELHLPPLGLNGYVCKIRISITGFL